MNPAWMDSAFPPVKVSEEILNAEPDMQADLDWVETQRRVVEQRFYNLAGHNTNQGMSLLSNIFIQRDPSDS